MFRIVKILVKGLVPVLRLYLLCFSFLACASLQSKRLNSLKKLDPALARKYQNKKAPHFAFFGKTSLRGLFICKFVLLFCFLSLPSAPLSADIIYLKNGKQIRGKFHGALGDLYQITLDNGRMKYIPEEEVRSVKITSKKTSASKDKGWLSRVSQSLSSFQFRFLLVLGQGDVEYVNEGLPETQPLSELGLGDVPGEAEVKYPESHSGSALQLAALAEAPLGPGTELLLGLDYTFLPGNKPDQPLTVDTPFQNLQGEDGTAKLSTEQTYAYTYFTFMLGLTSYLQVFDLYLSYGLRYTLSGSYSIKEKTEFEAEIPARPLSASGTEENTLKGSIQGRHLGFGLVIRKKIGVWKNRELSLNFITALDQIELIGKEEGSKPRKESVLFYGIGIGVSF